MRKAALILGIAVLAATPAVAADPAQIDWSQIPTSTVTLFYPGQASYEWVRSKDHPGVGPAQGGAACSGCHAGRERAMGNRIVKGGPLEPTPVKGKNGSVDLAVQAAYDSKNAYLRFQWKTLNPYGGTEHQY